MVSIAETERFAAFELGLSIYHICLLSALHKKWQHYCASALKHTPAMD
jgi:hypothetical protein